MIFDCGILAYFIKSNYKLVVKLENDPNIFCVYIKISLPIICTNSRHTTNRNSLMIQ